MKNHNADLHPTHQPLPPTPHHLCALASAMQVCKRRRIKGPETFHAHLGDVSASYSVSLGNWGMMISFSTWKLYKSFGLASKMVPIARLKPSWTGESKIIPIQDSQNNLRHAPIPFCTSIFKNGVGEGQRTQSSGNPGFGMWFAQD